MRVSIRWFVAGLACVLVFALLAAFKYFQIEAAIAQGKAYPEPSESVAAVTASASSFRDTFSTIGEIVAPHAVELRTEVEGQIIAVNVASGDRVAKGEILVELDVSEETARLAAARARADLAKLELERAQRLVKQKSVSEETRDRAQAAYDVARAEAMALEAAIAKKRLRAPFDAVVGLHDLDAGEFLQANAAVVTLVGIDDYSWVDFNVPVAQGEVTMGTGVAVTLPGPRGETVAATVIASSAVASATSRNLRLRARIDRALSLPPNAVVEVSVPVSGGEEIRLPRMALLFDSRGSYVFVLAENPGGEGYRAERRAVEVGYKDEETVAILAGLAPGELVATDGAFKLYPDILTLVQQRSAAAAESPAAEAETGFGGAGE